MKINLRSKAATGGLALLLCGIVASLKAQEPATNKNASKAHTQAQENLAASLNGRNWTSYNGDYSGQRYSSLSNINTSNVSHLRAAWIFHAENTSRLEVTPVVYNGVMYVTAANTVSALDARTGRELWKHDRALSSGLIDDAAAHKNRGVGLWKNRVYMQTDNAHLLCIDARSGRVLWDVIYADSAKGYGSTGAPLVVKDQVIVGTSGGDSGVRGFLASYDAESGELRWKFWTIPAPGEPGSSSWPGDAYLHGGGTTWMPGTYDPELNILYWTTSNPAPDFAGKPRPGDDLYTDCVLALDADTGTLKWHFQFTPHDLYDYDANETPVLIDVDEHGEKRKLLVQANRNGFLYILDRANGKLVRATRFLKEVTWATGIDEAGRPILSGLIPTSDGARICPGIDGGTNWYSPSYNPVTRTLYFLALEGCSLFVAEPSEYKEGATYYSTGTKKIPTEGQQKVLLAYTIPDGTLAWRTAQVGQGTSWGGTMTTAGGLVFFGDDSGSIAAVDARSGHPLWEFNTGQTIRASPMSYEVDGVQYVAIAAGSDVLSFSLDLH
jgi:alcohol dehydrogenase (cytochrome c)